MFMADDNQGSPGYLLPDGKQSGRRQLRTFTSSAALHKYTGLAACLLGRSQLPMARRALDNRAPTRRSALERSFGPTRWR